MKLYFFPILAILFCVSTVHAQCQSIENEIADFVKGKKATVGVAVLTDKNETIRYNNHVCFPLLSVFKLHVALAVLDKMDKQNVAIDSTILVKASNLRTNTYSPLQKKFPNQDLSISLGELLKYSISLSDNNACDILIDYAGGIKHIDDYIRRLGIQGFNLSETEFTMHLNTKNQNLNCSLPSEVAQLLKIADENNLFAPKYKDFLWQAMIETSTGANKLKGLLPSNAIVGHKTGSSDRTPEGMKIADNDAGMVILPDGRKYYIAVFVMNSYETDENNAAIIAHISRMIYDAML